MYENYEYIDEILFRIIGFADNEIVSDYCDLIARVVHAYIDRYGNQLPINRNGNQWYNCDKFNLEQTLMCTYCWALTAELIFSHCGHLICRKCLQIDGKILCRICLYELTDLDRRTRPNLYLNNIISVVMKDSQRLFERKNIANDKLRRQMYFEAVSDYTALLNEGFCRHIILSNRSYAYLIMGKIFLAMEDCKELLMCAGMWYKTHYRLAMIFKHQNNNYGVVAALINALILKQNDNLLMLELEEAFKMLLTPENKNRIREKFQWNVLRKEIQEEDLLDIIYKTNYKYWEKLFIDDRSCPISKNRGIHRSKSLEEMIIKKPKVSGLLKEKNKTKCWWIYLESELQISDFDCSLCMRICLNPVALICGHTFCRHCIQRSLDHTPACPLCKTDLQVYFQTQTITICKPLQNLFNAFWPIQVYQHELQYLKELFTLTRKPNYSSFMICIAAAPGMPCDLHLFEPRYRLMLRRAVESNVKQFGMVLHEPRSQNGHCEIGVMLKIKKVESLPEGRYFINTCASSTRFKILESQLVDGYLMAKIEDYVDNILSESKIKEFEALSLSVYKSAKKWIQMQTISIRDRFVKYFGEFPNYEPYKISKNDLYINNSNNKIVFNSQIYKRKRELKYISNESTNEPHNWIWWLCAVLPIDDKIKYVFISSRDPIGRMEQMKKVITSLIS